MNKKINKSVNKAFLCKIIDVSQNKNFETTHGKGMYRCFANIKQKLCFS